MWRGVRANLAELVAQFQDYISGVAVIKSFVREEDCAGQIEGRSGRFRASSIAANSVSLVPAGLFEGAGGIGVILVIWAGGAAALEGRIGVADLFVFIVYMGHIYQPFLHLASLNDVLQKAAVSTERVFELLAVEPDITDAPDAAVPKGMDWSVGLEQVSFGYETGQPVLRDIDFSIREGQVAALVGRTGAGKSSIASLVPRYYDPQQGAVHLGGVDVRLLPLDFVRGQVASVLQDVFLFHGSVRDNILFGRPDASEKQLRQAARAANAEEFIGELPEGFDTLIGERGGCGFRGGRSSGFPLPGLC